MLTDMAIKRLKPKDKLYKVADRDGMYVSVATTGQITFRYDYRLNGRRETLTIGRYGTDGLTLAEARERCITRRLQQGGIRTAAPAHAPGMGRHGRCLGERRETSADAVATINGIHGEGSCVVSSLRQWK